MRVGPTNRVWSATSARIRQQPQAIPVDQEKFHLVPPPFKIPRSPTDFPPRRLSQQIAFVADFAMRGCW